MNYVLAKISIGEWLKWRTQDGQPAVRNPFFPSKVAPELHTRRKILTTRNRCSRTPAFGCWESSHCCHQRWRLLSVAVDSIDSPSMKPNAGVLEQRFLVVRILRRVCNPALPCLEKTDYDGGLPHLGVLHFQPFSDADIFAKRSHRNKHVRGTVHSGYDFDLVGRNG